MTSFVTWSLLVNDWHFRAGSLPADVKPSGPQFLCACLPQAGLYVFARRKKNRARKDAKPQRPPEVIPSGP